MMTDLKHIIEALLFVADSPLSISRLKQIVTLAEADDIQNALDALCGEYDTRKGGFHLCQVAGGYQLRTRPEYAKWIAGLIQPHAPRLSKPALETLSIIAYRQPVIRSDIEFIRGVDCGSILRMLLEKNLIRILGRKDIPGRPLIYATTKKFLEVFDLKDLKDLPTPEEIEEMSAGPADQPAAENLPPASPDTEAAADINNFLD
ncbi:MAG: SMC-Scp complex subunit ScpB [Desulfobacterales bacterium]|nr:SMC-Scp complex subunit ScpB [Desulfobacterales bacterium]MDD4392169.1 SMC-Scp complex subunit ScpB [Desulfobacterales bacterium]